MFNQNDNKPAASRKAFMSPEHQHWRDLRLLSPATGETGQRGVDLSFSSDAGLLLWDWWNEKWYKEILDHSEEAVDLGRLKSTGVALFNHDENRVIGRLEDVRIDKEEKKGKCRLIFDDDDFAENIRKKVASGTLKGVSVGFRVFRWEELSDDMVSREGIEGPAMIARSWEPYEISIVSCPADNTVGVGRSLQKKQKNHNGDDRVKKFREQATEIFRKYAAKEITKESFEGEIRALLGKLEAEEKPEATRFINEMRTAAGMTAQPPAPKAQELSPEDEKTRALEIMSICTAHGVPQDDIAGYIKEGKSVETVCRDILTKQSQEQHGVPVGRAIGVADAKDKLRAAVIDGLRMRAGRTLKEPAPGAEDFRGMRLAAIARECLERNGEKVSVRDPEEDVVKRSFSSSDFPEIMTALAKATLVDAYSETPATWREWCGIESATDFKEQHKIRLGEMPLLEPVLEGGEYKMADMMETKASFAIGTFGKKFALTRKAIINDELGAFTRIPHLFGSAAARTIEQSVYSLLVSNPTLEEDNTPLFSEGHSNLAATASVLSVQSLSAARVAMRRQSGLRQDAENRVQLNLTPKYLLVPPELETLARQMIYSDTDISNANPNAINPFKGAFIPVIVPYITDYSWYLAASPNDIDTVEVVFLGGQQSPTIEQMPGWNIDGIEYKVRLDFGVWCYDYRGLYKNAGANPTA